MADAAVALDGGICCDPGIFRFSEEGVSAKDVFRQVIPAIEVCIRLKLEGSATLLEALRKSLTATASSRRSF